MEPVRRFLLILPLVLVVVLPVVIAFRASETTVSAQTADTPGALTAFDAQGQVRAFCPLTHTDVKAEITGFLSRVVVTQHFQNPLNEKLEAVYTFPLPHNAAVDDMTMIIGDRTIRGKILPREEAQAVYEGARARGQVAGLLDQERPNIFTQSVTNILPGNQIKITISYIETLKYESGAYEFVFPMVVGPRYIPRMPISISQAMPFPADRNNMPDMSRLVPPAPAAGERSGHDISLDVTLDAGLIIESLESRTHPVDIERPSPTRAHLRLQRSDTLPNKDFILRYDIAGKTIQDAVLAHRSEKGGFFTLILQPPDKVGADDVTPKELVFVLDTSGSMAGFPIEKAKETMKLALDNLYPDDTFNLITFSGDTRILFEQPVRATKRNLRLAQDFLSATSGAGGTEMMGAIKAALEPSDRQSHVRIACFMTDGFVGNDMAIIDEIQKHKNARVFAFGIGSSVNRFLLDNMATAGRGEVEYVGLNDDGSAAAQRFHQRVRNPLLTDISIDWGDLPVTDIYPKRVPDLFGAKPLVLTGRYTAGASGTIKLKGKTAGSEFTREIPVTLPDTMALHDVLAPLWARARIDNLMSEDYMGAQLGRMRGDLMSTIVQLGMEFRLMTQFTSFIAVEEVTVTDGGTIRRIHVPVDVPEGTNRNFMVGGVLGNLGGSPTGLFTVYDGRVLQQGNYRFQALAAAQNSGGAAYVITPKATGSPSTKTFSGGVSAASATTPSAAPPQLTEQERFELLRRKLNIKLLAIIYQVKNKVDLRLLNYGDLVRDGKAEVQVWLTDKNELTKEQLRQLGFETVLDHNSSNVIIGRISMDKLEQLAQLEFVRYVSPQTTR